MEKSLKKIIILIIIFLLIAINIWIFVSNNMEKETSNNSENIVTNKDNTIASEKTMEEKVNNKVAKMDEISRAKYYCGKFIEAIESKNYELAYSFLNQTYKSNYFSTIEEFTAYIQKKFPKNGIIVKYTSVDKKGEVFVLDALIYDEDDDEFKEFNQSFVIREISLNNFSMSFSKDEENGERSK